MRKRTEVITTRLSYNDKQLIEKYCTDRDVDISTFIRSTVRKELAQKGYYSDDVKKAFDLKLTPNQWKKKEEETP